MKSLSNIRKKIIGSPMGFVALGVGMIFMGVAFHKYYWKPIVKRHKQETFKQHANFLYEQMKLNNEDMSDKTP